MSKVYIPLSEYDLELFKELVYSNDEDFIEWIIKDETGQTVKIIFIKEKE